jgi:hypothetical protein
MSEKISHITSEEQVLKSRREGREQMPLKEREEIFALTAGLRRFGEFMSEARKGTNIGAEKQKQLLEIKRKAGKALKLFFRAVKISAGVGVVAAVIGGPEGFDTALDWYAGRNSASSETDVLHKHPTFAKIAEWYFGQNLMEIIEQYQRLAQSRVNGQMTPEEVAFRERISDNIFPGTQGEADLDSKPWKTTELGKLKIQFQNFDQNTGRVSKQALEALPESDTYQKYVKTGTEVRSDMFRLYLGLSTHFNYVEDSPYKPTKAKNPDASYKSFPAREIINSIREVGQDMKKNDELSAENEPAYAATSFDALWTHTQQFKSLPRNAYTQALGTYLVDQGYDPVKQERYISYYDIWDLDIKPFRLAGLDMNQYNFPFEVYGRIYQSDLQ